jgi:hypothetical protein
MLKLGWFGVSLFKDTSIYVYSYTVYMLYIYCIDMYVYGWDVWHFFVLRKLGVREKFAKNRFPGSWTEGAEGALSDVGLTAVWLWASYPPVSTWLEIPEVNGGLVRGHHRSMENFPARHVWLPEGISLLMKSCSTETGRPPISGGMVCLFD